MVEIPFKLGAFDASAIELIDNAIAQHGLIPTMKGTLKSYPGCTHWHCKLGREKGTLEITLWPAKQRAWFKIQAGRKAPWIDEVVPKLKRTLEA